MWTASEADVVLANGDRQPTSSPRMAIAALTMQALNNI
jgi:hypothetical protein